MHVITNTDFNCKNSDLVQDQNGFGHGSLPTVTGKLSDVRPLLRDNVENNQRDAQQKRENKLQKGELLVPSLHSCSTLTQHMLLIF